MEQQQQIQLLQQAQQIAQLQEQVQQLLPLQQQVQVLQQQNQIQHEQVQVLQQQNQQQQEQIEQFQQQQEEIEIDDDDEEEEDDDDDPLVIGDALSMACRAGDVKTIISLLEEGKDVNCVSVPGMTPVMWALWQGNLLASIMLAGRGADLSRVDNDDRNCLHHAAIGGARE
jgi:ankyrin repeat protein